MQEDLHDPRGKLLSNVNFSKCRVEFSKSPIVLLCGGKLPEPKAHPDDPDPPIKSLRHAICNSNLLTSYEIFRPEEITSWETKFKDLMSFEKDLAAICSLVVIILESEGSLVELGAFSQLKDLSQKIIAIKSAKFDDEISFINLGVLRYIKERHKTSVKSFPWLKDEPQNISTQVVSDVIEEIGSEIDKLNKTENFELSKESHRIVLICEIIKHFVALKKTEIKKYLDDIDIIITDEELNGKLFLLEKFKLIKKLRYSDSAFYERTDENYHRIRLSLTTDKQFDSVRFNMQCLEYYRQDKSHKNRIRAIDNAHPRLSNE
jgi:hypothetical protein